MLATEQSEFLFLSLVFEVLGGSEWPSSLSYFWSLVSRVTFSTRAYLLVIANMSLDIMGFFMASLWINDESLCPFLKNMMMYLSSTSGMMFLLLQKHWINSWRYSPFFCMALAKSQLTPGHAHIA
jgi:hypothetical protein